MTIRGPVADLSICRTNGPAGVELERMHDCVVACRHSEIQKVEVVEAHDSRPHKPLSLGCEMPKRTAGGEDFESDQNCSLEQVEGRCRQKAAASTNEHHEASRSQSWIAAEENLKAWKEAGKGPTYPSVRQTEKGSKPLRVKQLGKHPQVEHELKQKKGIQLGQCVIAPCLGGILWLIRKLLSLAKTFSMPWKMKDSIGKK